MNLSVFALLLGARSFTDEFRHGTVVWKVLATNERWKVVVDKAAVAAGCAGAMAASAQALGHAVALTMGLGAGRQPERRCP